MSHTMIVTSYVSPTNHHHVHRHCKHKTREAMSSITFRKENEGRNPLRKCALDWTTSLNTPGRTNDKISVWQWSWVILPRIFGQLWVLQWMIQYILLYVKFEGVLQLKNAVWKYTRSHDRQMYFSVWPILLRLAACKCSSEVTCLLSYACMCSSC